MTFLRTFHNSASHVWPAFNDDLDFVSVHAELREEFTAVIQTLRGRQSLDSQTDAIVRAKASGLGERSALTLVRSIFSPQLSLAQLE